MLHDWLFFQFAFVGLANCVINKTYINEKHRNELEAPSTTKQSCWLELPVERPGALFGPVISSLPPSLPLFWPATERSTRLLPRWPWDELNWALLSIVISVLPMSFYLVIIPKPFQDLPNAMNAAEITDKLGLHSLRNRNWYIQVR